MKKNNELRMNTKIAKVMNDDIFTYKDFAEAIGIKHQSFLNWLNGAYELSEARANQLKDFISNLLD